MAQPTTINIFAPIVQIGQKLRSLRSAKHIIGSIKDSIETAEKALNIEKHIRSNIIRENYCYSVSVGVYSDYHHKILTHWALPKKKHFPNFTPLIIYVELYNFTYTYRYSLLMRPSWFYLCIPL